MLNEHDLLSLREKVLMAMDTTLPLHEFLEHSFGIWSTLMRLGLDKDEDLNYLQELDSDLDSFPIGPIRKFWNADALAKEDQKIENLYSDVKDELPKIYNIILGKIDRELERFNQL
ncbi:hypothetical protein [Emcibacter nanhaiensis]|uniref:DUF2489 domain-containing protein n=1 Tax=Emcibacter nanhaiensis TaxID=1505037 RepID=A0A501PHB3_9PROT|nr:hypothetical protein [Emcibacter nanhaiensis]TPD59422.1 hypothetical protein FIV46_11550 [Emcibacter nanhaiensis]